MNKKQKKAWIRILEAFIAIMIMLGFFLSIISRQHQESSPETSEQIYTLERQLLKEASENNTVRNTVLAYPETKNTFPVMSFLYPRVPGGFAYNISICEIFESCELKQKVKGNVYADDTLISSNLSQAPISPLMLRLFLWVGKSTFNPEIPPISGGCTESWTCTPWMPVICPLEQIQTRTCTDSNNCGTTNDKPNEMQTCIYSPTCTAQWVCIDTSTRKHQLADCSYDITDPQPACEKQLGVCANSKKKCVTSDWQVCDYTTIAGYSVVESGPSLCYDGKDNDCDGVYDLTQPGCV